DRREAARRPDDGGQVGDEGRHCPVREVMYLVHDAYHLKGEKGIRIISTRPRGASNALTAQHPRCGGAAVPPHDDGPPAEADGPSCDRGRRPEEVDASPRSAG